MRSRIFTLIVVYVVLFSILVGRLFYLQIVQGEAYDEQATIKNEKQKTIKSSRGKIYDCNGKLLASNEQSYAITLEDTGEIESNKQMNEMILKCINLIEKNGDKVTVDFPITIDKKGRFKFTVDKNAQLRFKREIYFFLSGATSGVTNFLIDLVFRYKKANLGGPSCVTNSNESGVSFPIRSRVLYTSVFPLSSLLNPSIIK